MSEGKKIIFSEKNKNTKRFRSSKNSKSSQKNFKSSKFTKSYSPKRNPKFEVREEESETFKEQKIMEFDSREEKRDSKKKEKVTKVIVNKNCILIDFLREHFSDKSRTTIKSLLSNQQITIHGKVVKQYNYALKENDEISVHWSKGVIAVDSPLLNIIYEDDSIIVINKKQGLLSIATKKERIRTAYSILSEYLKKKDKKNKIFVIHRLDRDTSGLMVFAKSQEIQYEMQSTWRSGTTNKQYVTIVEGIMETRNKEGKGTIKSYLYETKALKVYSTPDPEKGGDLAITHYKILKTDNNYTMLLVTLETGKKNQIRVHMNSIGHPVAGDKKYGGHICKMNRLALHAVVLSFIHPKTGKMMTFDTGIPKDFEYFIKNN